MANPCEQDLVHLRPIADIDSGGWEAPGGSTSNLYLLLDEATPSETSQPSDYIHQFDTGDTGYVCRLDAGSAPANPVQNRLRWRMLIPEITNYTVYFYSGATLITSQAFTAQQNSAWTTYGFSLTNTQIDAISDWADIRIQVAANKTTLKLSWLEFVYPEDPAGSVAVSVAGGPVNYTNVGGSLIYSASVGDTVMVVWFPNLLAGFPVGPLVDNVGNQFTKYLDGSFTGITTYYGVINIAGGTNITLPAGFGIARVYALKLENTFCSVGNDLESNSTGTTIVTTANSPRTIPASLSLNTRRYQDLLIYATYSQEDAVFTPGAGYTEIASTDAPPLTTGLVTIGYKIVTPNGAFITSIGTASVGTPGSHPVGHALMLFPDRSGATITDPDPLPVEIVQGGIDAILDRTRGRYYTLSPNGDDLELHDWTLDEFGALSKNDLKLTIEDSVSPSIVALPTGAVSMVYYDTGNAEIRHAIWQHWLGTRHVAALSTSGSQPKHVFDKFGRLILAYCLGGAIYVRVGTLDDDGVSYDMSDPVDTEVTDPAETQPSLEVLPDNSIHMVYVTGSGVLTGVRCRSLSSQAVGTWN
jgi:hypothetical protein